MLQGTVVSTGGDFVNILGFLLIILSRLLADQTGSSGMVAGFDKVSTQKIPPQIF